MVTEADFVLYKLLEMQAVGEDLVQGISEYFGQLDSGGEGTLEIGVEVPSAAQARELLLLQEDKGGELMDLWGEMQAEARRAKDAAQQAEAEARATAAEAEAEDEPISKGFGAAAGGAGAVGKGAAGGLGKVGKGALGGMGKVVKVVPVGKNGNVGIGAVGGVGKVGKGALGGVGKVGAGAIGGVKGLKPVGPGMMPGMKMNRGKSFRRGSHTSPTQAKSLAGCNDFSWSRELWAEAADKTGRFAVSSFAAFLVAGYLLLCLPEGLDAVDSM